jgi:predicted permease
MALAMLVALGCGIGPAWRASGADPQEALRAGGTRTGAGTAQHRFLNLLIMGEVALALVLLLAAGLVMRGFLGLLRQDPGFDPKPLLTLVVNLPNERYKEATTADAFLEPALDAIRGVPGVADAGAINLLPYDNWGWNWNVRYEGRPAGDPTRYPLVENRVVNPTLFPTLGMRLLAGRLLTDADDGRPGAPAVVVVNHALAARDFPGEDPVGRRFYTSDTSFATIVGVVADIRNEGPFNPADAEMYWSYAQNNTRSVTFPIVVRVRRGEPGAVAGTVQAAIRSVEPAAAISQVRSMEEIIATSVGQPRFYLVLLGLFAAVALLLSAAGLYGLTTYAVARRTREIGIRTALGATPAQATALVLRDGVLLVAGGLAAGGALGVMATRLLTRLLYGVSPLDPVAWAAVSTVLALAGGVAAFVPARHAARVDPLAAIRAE